MKPILAGALTGAIESFATYPTEYVKTHLQLQDKTNVKYTGIVDCFVKTVKEHGPTGLYRGMTPILVGSIPKQASRWGAYEASVMFVSSRKQRALTGVSPESRGVQRLGVAETSACGFVAGSVEAVCAVIPTETIKTRLIDDAKSARPQYSDKSLLTAVRLLIRDEGVRGVYAGVSNTVTKQGLNQSIRFPVQMTVMSYFCGGNAAWREKNPFWNGLAGFIAGIVSVVVTQPFDVVKTKMQGGEAGKYKGSLDCWMRIAREQGLSHFYSGSVARMMRVGGNVALTFTIFPVIKSFL